MRKDDIKTAKSRVAGQATVRTVEDWCAMIDRHYPDLEWLVSPDYKYDIKQPTPVLHMQMKHKKVLFGLLNKTLTRVMLAQDRKHLDVDTLLGAFGLALQGSAYLRNPNNKTKEDAIIRGPKPDMNAMRVLLKADIFTTLLMYGVGERDIVHRRARRRAEALLTARHGADPSLFALPLATDTIQVVLPTLTRKAHIIDRVFINEALQRSEDICRCIDPSSFTDWYGFGQAAQDMAWRGASKRTILGAAFIADAPNIRTMAMRISELTGLIPHTAEQFTGAYSSFADQEVNQRAHARAMNQEFDWILTQDPIKNGSRVFLQAADRQITNLQKGQVLGWCADALHVSAKAFDDKGGNSPEALAAAREAFDDHKNTNAWDQLNRLGEQIVDICRKGLLVDVKDLYEMATKHSNLDGLRNALDAHIMTMDAPHHAHVAPEFVAPAAGPAPAPATPAPAPTLTPIARPKAPVPGGPGMSGGSAPYVPVPYVPVPPPDMATRKDAE